MGLEPRFIDVISAILAPARRRVPQDCAGESRVDRLACEPYGAGYVRSP